jgi:solute:Na+ symporter, SSS family
MNLSTIDWLIAVTCYSVIFYIVIKSKKYIKGVADFLSAGRSAGRYMLTVSQGMVAMGAITVVAQWEMNYVAGFNLRWWEFTMAVVILIITVSGWVLYRFRQTRALTMAQFLEMRYSRSFRIFAGILAFVSGLLNFGIFPAVTTNFLIYFCGLPHSFYFAGIEVSTFPVVMALLLLISIYFVFSGGQIAIIFTEFIQGILANFSFVIIILFCLLLVNWNQIFEAVSMAPENASLINPYKTREVPHFNFWFFLINAFGLIYTKLSWQGTQGFYSSAKSAHEAKMGEVLSNFREIPRMLFLVFIPIIAYTVLHHADFSSISSNVNGTLSTVDSVALQNQLRIPLILAEILPIGLMGVFLVVMIMAAVGTNNSYLHSWGVIFIQDIIMPFRKKPFESAHHLRILRLSILVVSVFVFFFSLYFPLTQYIVLYFAITAAIFVGGSGAVIVGGLYWKRGTTTAAWSALITGSVVAVTGIIILQLHPEFFIDGQKFWAIAMGAASVVYILVSLLGKKHEFNMDKMLHRGKYAIKSEMKIVDVVPQKGWRVLGIGKEFTKGDKIIYLAAYTWTFCWVVVFLIGTVLNLTGDVPDSAWMSFWRIFVLINLAVSVIVVVWFTVGGIADFKNMIERLRHMVRDPNDDGWVKKDMDEKELAEKFVITKPDSKND